MQYLEYIQKICDSIDAGEVDTASFQKKLEDAVKFAEANTMSFEEFMRQAKVNKDYWDATNDFTGGATFNEQRAINAYYSMYGQPGTNDPGLVDPYADSWDDIMFKQTYWARNGIHPYTGELISEEEAGLHIYASGWGVLSSIMADVGGALAAQRGANIRSNIAAQNRLSSPWNKGTFKSSYESLESHYTKHVVKKVLLQRLSNLSESCQSLKN